MDHSLKIKKNKSNIIYTICIITSLIFVNIQPLTDNLPFVIAVLFGVTTISAVIILLNYRGGFKLQSWYLGFWLMIIFFVFSLINTLSYSQSLKYILFYLIALMMMSILITDTNWFSVLWKGLAIFITAHVIITLISYFYTDLYISLFVPFLNASSRVFTLSYIYNFNFYAGIAGQTGTNAFYISLGLAIIIPKTLAEKKNISKNYLFSIIDTFPFGVIFNWKKGTFIS